MKNREALLMDFGWKFHKGDINYKPKLNMMRTYSFSKSASGMGAASIDFFDNDWRTVDLPHDYVVEGKPDPLENDAHGNLPRDNAWYRRTFILDNDDHEKRVSLIFDGVATKCTIWVNGHPMIRNFTGGIGFEVDFTDVANYGEDVNVVSVYIDNRDFEGWYYEGGGIYRHVWLVKTQKVAVGFCGTFIHSSERKDGLWETEIETTVLNDNFKKMTATLVSEIVDVKDIITARAESEVMLYPRENTIVKQLVWVKKPALWSIEEPNLYTLKTLLFINDEQSDTYKTTFGYRTILFDSDKGFFLNGKNIKIKGMSNHQDYGGLGVALPDRVHEFRIKRLKEMGSNAYRCAHNPHAPEIYDACDRHGMMVMDETRWFDSSTEGLKQLKSMILRDRNHPSVIMWSILNEELIMEKESGLRITKSMVDISKKLDGTRPVTAALYIGVLTPGVGEALDIIGINYQTPLYDILHKMYPDKPILSSESGQGFSADGIDAWRQVNMRPYIMGFFPWTGMQYRGESVWPSIFSFGWSHPIDQCGLPTVSYYMYKAFWAEEPFAMLSPHWNRKKGEKIEVVTFTNGDTAELFLNSVSLGEKPVDPYEMVKWIVSYEPGTLKVVVKKAGCFHSEHETVTTGEAVKIKLVLEDDDVRADGEDVAIVTAYAVDINGRVVPTADGYLIEFSVNEFGKILGVGSPDEADHEVCTEPRRKTYKGCCQVIVKSSDKQGQLKIKAVCKQLSDGELIVDRESYERRIYVKPDSNRYIPLWKMSPVFCEVPDIEMITKADTDKWETVEVGHGSQGPFSAAFPRFTTTPKPDIKRAFVLYQADCLIPKHNVGDTEAALLFERIEGKAEIIAICENKRISKVSYDFGSSSILMKLPGFITGDKVSIWVILEGHAWNDSVDRPVRWMFKH